MPPRRTSTPPTKHRSRAMPARPAFHAYPLVHPHDRAAWRAWLAANHATSPGIWLVFDKKPSRPDRLAYGDAVEEALCFGWIDSLTNKLDAHRYKQLFTPRKPGSNWSGLNKRRIEKVVAAGLMTVAGQAKIDAAKRDGSWTQLDAVEALEMPADLTAALARHRRAAANFAAFPPSARRALLYWVTSARRPDTRARRVARVVVLAAANQRSPH